MYRWGEHTGELDLAIEADSEEGVFAEGLAALRELFGEPGGGDVVHREIAANGSDRSTLLAAWLEELLFLAETEDLVPERLVALELGAEDVRATVDMGRGRPRHLVKAVTYHGLEFTEIDGRWRAHVVLDV